MEEDIGTPNKNSISHEKMVLIGENILQKVYDRLQVLTADNERLRAELESKNLTNCNFPDCPNNGFTNCDLQRKCFGDLVYCEHHATLNFCRVRRNNNRIWTICVECHTSLTSDGKTFQEWLC